MINLTNTIQLTELLWTLVAIPGLLLWASNRMRAAASLRATKRLSIGNGRRAFAQFAVRETTAWVFVEALFVTIGVVAMTNAPPPRVFVLARLFVSVGLIVAAVMITVLGREWRRVDRELVRAAVAKMTAAQDATGASQSVTMVAQDGREVVQNVREEEQNTRDEAQDARDGRQNTRQGGQDKRQAQQDSRGDATT